MAERALPDCTESGPLVHLAGLEGATACGTFAKLTTRSAAGVTCRRCRSTWLFEAASTRDRIHKRIKGASRG